MQPKTCKRCGTEKDLISGFYANDNTCKDCRKERVRANRAAKVEYYRAYDRKRFKEDPRVKARNEAYAKTKAGKAAGSKAKTKWIESNLIKRSAQVMAGNAIRDGRLKKELCEVCGSKTVHAHHDDYAKPLDVRWLCPKHHKEWHAKHGEGANAT
jgi:ribosomal protein S27AE